MTTMKPTLYLAGGMQSGGTTIISWCFLQRPDLVGIVDMANDIIEPVGSKRSNAWCKFTIGCFRFVDLIPHFEDEGYVVKPMLIVRDVRSVWQSLCRKEYGLNGVTSEDPPLRMRFRRFLADWELFCRMGWPVIRYEDFVDRPESILRSSCEAIGLPWHSSMLDWNAGASADLERQLQWTNGTFRASRGRDLLATVRRATDTKVNLIQDEDLAWLESAFAEYNIALGYPETLKTDTRRRGRALPSFETTRRIRWEKMEVVSHELRDLATMLRLPLLVRLARKYPAMLGLRGIADAASRIERLAGVMGDKTPLSGAPSAEFEETKR